MTSFTPPVDIAAWLACAAFVVFLFNQLSRAWFTLRGKPSPLEQAKATNDIEQRVAKIETCIGACKKEQDQRLGKLEETQAALRELIDTKVGDVYERVKEVAEDTNVMRGELKGLNHTSSMILEKLMGKR
jgi:archaellum component FlaC